MTEKEAYNKAIDDVAELIEKNNLYTSKNKLTPYQEQYNMLVKSEIAKIMTLKK